jgi:hypothetical protein
LEIDAIVNAGWSKPPPYVRFDPLKYSRPSGVTTEDNVNAASDDTTSQGAAAQPPDGQRVPAPTSPAGNVMLPVPDPTGDVEGTNTSVQNDPLKATEPHGSSDSAQRGNTNPSNAEPSGSADGENVELAAAGDLKCTGGRCAEGGSWGTTGSHIVRGRILCPTSAEHELGVNQSPAQEKFETMRPFEIQDR